MTVRKAEKVRGIFFDDAIENTVEAVSLFGHRTGNFRFRTKDKKREDTRL